MYKKILSCAVMLGMAIAGYATADQRTELAKNAAKEQAQILLNGMQAQLKEGKGAKIEGEKAKVDFGKAKECAQFLYDTSKIGENLGLTEEKDQTLNKVFKELRKNIPNEFKYESITIGDVTYKVDKKERIDSNECTVPVTFQAHTIAKDGASDVKYTIVSQWRVKPEYVKKKGTFEIDGTPELISVEVNTLDLLNSDKAKMQQLAKESIEKWYANLPQTLDKKYASQAIKAVNPVNNANVKLGVPNSRNFTVTNVPQVTIDIDPNQFIASEEAVRYTNPNAQLKITPKFNVTINNALNAVEKLDVTYTVETIKPLADQEKAARHQKANAVVTDFAGKLASYIETPSKEAKAELEAMFVAPDKEVGVSFMPKYGKEQLKDVPAKRYLSRVKGTSININLNGIEVEGDNWESVAYPFSQEYSSKTYNDYTEKKIYLTYDTEKGTYLIEKIEVLPNTTTRR